MKKKIVLSAVAAASVVLSYAQDITYSAASIPAGLKEGAHVVTRLEENKYVVKDLDKASLSVHKIYTILDEEGKNKLLFYLNTNKTKRVDEVDIRVYDATGKQVNRFKKKDLQKQASQGGLVEDGMFHWLAI